MTELTSPGAAADAAAPVSRSRRNWQLLLLISIALVIYVSDQLTKNWVVGTLPEGRPVPVLGEFLQWYFVRNPGAAFSFAGGATWVFTLLSVAVVGVIIWQLKHIGSRWWAVFFGLLLGGVLGNLTDRLTREPGFPVGHVIDFISTPWMMPAIYNIADIGIVTGMIVFVAISLFGVPIDGSPRDTRARRAALAQAEAEAEATVTAKAAEVAPAVGADEAARQNTAGAKDNAVNSKTTMDSATDTSHSDGSLRRTVSED